MFMLSYYRDSLNVRMILFSENKIEKEISFLYVKTLNSHHAIYLLYFFICIVMDCFNTINIYSSRRAQMSAQVQNLS